MEPDSFEETLHGAAQGGPVEAAPGSPPSGGHDMAEAIADIEIISADSDNDMRSVAAVTQSSRTGD
eukprot:2912303-Pyramimonas_sp.AAC.3